MATDLQRIMELETQVSNLKAATHGFEFHIDELKRKSRGTTLANKRVAAVERNQTSLEQRIASLTARLEQLPAPSGGASSVSPSVLADIQQEINRLNKAITDHYNRLQTENATLSSTVDGHGRRIERLESSDVGKIDFKKSEIETTYDAKINVDSPWGTAFIIGIAAGFLTALALNWWIAPDWNAVKDFWASLIVGVAAFMFMASFERFRVNLNISSQMKWYERAPEPDMPKTTVTPSIFVSHDDTTDTKVVSAQNN